MRFSPAHFFEKSLPNVLIPGIPRLHVAADLRRILNYFASGCFSATAFAQALALPD
jgi:hypothetical protein